MKRKKVESAYDAVVKQRVAAIDARIEVLEATIYDNATRYLRVSLGEAGEEIQRQNAEKLRIARFTSLTEAEEKMKRGIIRAVKASKKRIVEADDIPSIA